MVLAKDWAMILGWCVVLSLVLQVKIMLAFLLSHSALQPRNWQGRMSAGKSSFALHQCSHLIDGSAKWSRIHVSLAEDRASLSWCAALSLVLQVKIPPMLTSDGSVEWSHLHMSLAKDWAI